MNECAPTPLFWTQCEVAAATAAATSRLARASQHAPRATNTHANAGAMSGAVNEQTLLAPRPQPCMHAAALWPVVGVLAMQQRALHAHYSPHPQRPQARECKEPGGVLH
jgi:hypothetical protein